MVLLRPCVVTEDEASASGCVIIFGIFDGGLGTRVLRGRVDGTDAVSDDAPWAHWNDCISCIVLEEDGGENGVIGAAIFGA